MEYGSILAKQFDTPQPQQSGSGRGVGRPAGAAKEPDFKYDDYLTKAFEGLDRSTPDAAQAAQQYYQDWAALRSFAKSMWVKYRVDVTSPDPSDENAIWANQAYQQKLALLMNNVDRAKNDFKVYQDKQSAAFAGNFIPSTGFNGSSSLSPVTQQGQVLYDETPASKELPSGAMNITGSEARGENTRIDSFVQESLKRAADARARGDEATANFYDQEARTASQKKVIASENTDSNSGGAGSTNTGSAIKEWALLAEGSNRYFTLPEKPKYTKEGRPLYEAVPTGWVGTQFGTKTTGANKGKPFTIAKMVYDYGTGGGGQAYFEDAEGERKEMDKRNVVSGVREYINSNKGGFSLADFNKFLKEKGLGSDIVPSRRLLDEFEAQEVFQSQQSGGQVSKAKAPEVKAVFDSYLGQVDELYKTKPRSILGYEIPFTETAVRDNVTIPLETGQTAKIIKGEDGTYRIDNWSSIFPKDKDKITVKDRVITKNEALKLSKDDLFELLNYIGIDVNLAPPTTDPWSKYKKTQ